MAENFTIYSQTYDALPKEQMRELAGAAIFAIDSNKEGRRFTYKWSHLIVTVNEMPAPNVPSHLDGFCGFVRRIYGGQPDARGEQVLDRIRYTRLVAEIIIEPKRDDEGRTFPLPPPSTLSQFTDVAART